MRSTPRIAAAIACTAAVLLGRVSLTACTAFCAVGAGGQVLVGNNEDWSNPRSKLWFVPASDREFGRMYVGFDDLVPQGGMNERGLWFDAFAAPALDASDSTDLPRYNGNIVDAAMAQCSTVEEVVRLFNRYERSFLSQAIYMFADATGDAVSIERNAIVRKTRSHFVQTNFHQSLTTSEGWDGRFKTASTMLERAGPNISVDLFRTILAATYQRAWSPTLYSNVYDLRSRTMHLYYFHDFTRVVTFGLADELKKGKRVVDIPSLFPRNEAAEKYAARRAPPPPETISEPTLFIGLGALLCAVVGIAVYSAIRGGRRVRLVLAGLVGAAALGVAAAVMTVQVHPEASKGWIEFSIGPASGRSTGFSGVTLRSDGITLQAAIGLAYDVPAIRVIGPSWLSGTRYSISAITKVDAPDSFRPLMQEELKNRMRLETHTEMRPFDVFVLTGAGATRLERSHIDVPSIWMGDDYAQMQGTSMEMLASTVQRVLGKPVIDETGITGVYMFDLEWSKGDDASIIAALDKGYGLKLSPARRDLEALVVDHIRRDPALVILEQIGRATSAAPPDFRRKIARFLAMH